METETGQDYGQDYLSNSSLPVVCWHGINSNAKRWSNLVINRFRKIYIIHQCQKKS